ncbi:MAG TPA: adenylyl-sulfate kinase [Polyangiaceae bacterium]|nr:adenylyl-sulfate kinase [Polyangiaceae bacterium]
MSFDTGFTVWLTGLPCSGKSSVAKLLAERLLNQGRLVEVLDGDVVRQNLSQGLGFTREDRDRNVRRVGFVANLLSRNGVAVVVSLVSPYRATRDEVRATIGRFVEVHVDCPISECERRDVKGMYSKARAGTLQGFTGVDDPYECPEHPEITLHTNRETVEESTGVILGALRRLGYGRDEASSPGSAPNVRQRMLELGVWRPE